MSTSTQGVGGSSSVYAMNPSQTPAGLMSPEELMSFVEQQLMAIDKRLRSESEAVYQANTRSDSLNRAKAKLTNLKGTSPSTEERRQSGKELASWASSIQDKTVRDNVMALAKQLQAGKMPPDGDVQKAIDGLQTQLDSKGNMEVTMIQMQQMMQARSRLLNFVSNVLKAINAPLDTMVRNMG